MIALLRRVWGASSGPPCGSVRDLHPRPRAVAVAFTTGRLFFLGSPQLQDHHCSGPNRRSLFLQRCDFFFCLPPGVILPCFVIRCQARHLTCKKENVFILLPHRSVGSPRVSCVICFVFPFFFFLNMQGSNGTGWEVTVDALPWSCDTEIQVSDEPSR